MVVVEVVVVFVAVVVALFFFVFFTLGLFEPALILEQGSSCLVVDGHRNQLFLETPSTHRAIHTFIHALFSPRQLKSPQAS